MQLQIVEKKYDEEITDLKEQLRLKTSECVTLISNKRKADEDMKIERKRFLECAHENEKLKTKLQQLNSVCKPVERKNKAEKWIEVEKLLNHEERNGQLFFLVKWENYGQEHNLWVPENHLRCPTILLNYKKKNNI